MIKKQSDLDWLHTVFVKVIRKGEGFVNRKPVTPSRNGCGALFSGTLQSRLRQEDRFAATVKSGPDRSSATIQTEDESSFAMGQRARTLRPVFPGPAPARCNGPFW